MPLECRPTKSCELIEKSNGKKGSLTGDFKLAFKKDESKKKKDGKDEERPLPKEVQPEAQDSGTQTMAVAERLLALLGTGGSQRKRASPRIK